MFKKEELGNFGLVKLRNGDFMLVVKDGEIYEVKKRDLLIGLNFESGQFLELDDYSEDLLYEAGLSDIEGNELNKSMYDIMEVYHSEVTTPLTFETLKKLILKEVNTSELKRQGLRWKRK